MCGFCTSSAALSHISASIPSADCQARSPDCVQMTWTTRSWRDSDPPYPCRAAGAARLVSSRIDTLSVRLAHCHVTGTVTAILAGGRSSPTASRSTFSGNPPPLPPYYSPFLPSCPAHPFPTAARSRLEVHHANRPGTRAPAAPVPARPERATRFSPPAHGTPSGPGRPGPALTGSGAIGIGATGPRFRPHVQVRLGNSCCRGRVRREQLGGRPRGRKEGRGGREGEGSQGGALAAGQVGGGGGGGAGRGDVRGGPGVGGQVRAQGAG